jgi:sec-independent protein translocase protein TatC
MTLVEHLLELRYRVVLSVLALVVGIGVAYALWEPIFAFLRSPYCGTAQGERSCNLYALGVFDQFTVRMRVAIIGGAVLSSPVWIFHVGRFLTPALHRKERRYALGFMASGLVLFTAGVAIAYVTVARGLELFLQVGGSHVVPILTVQSYLSFVTVMMLACGAAFQFPLVVMFLNVTGLLSADRMRRSRRGVLFGTFLVAAVVVPTTDPFTFLAMALPLSLLYEVCIVLARIREKRAGSRRRELDELEASLWAELGLHEVSAGSESG